MAVDDITFPGCALPPIRVCSSGEYRCSRGSCVSPNQVNNVSHLRRTHDTTPEEDKAHSLKQNRTEQNRIAQYGTAPYRTALHRTAPYRTAPQHTATQCTATHLNALHCTARHCTAQCVPSQNSLNRTQDLFPWHYKTISHGACLDTTFNNSMWLWRGRLGVLRIMGEVTPLKK